MRAILLAAIVAVGFGLATTPTVSAAPANGFAISGDAAGTSNVQHVQHWRWGSRRHWRRCHYRHRSWGRCGW